MVCQGHGQRQRAVEWAARDGTNAQWPKKLICKSWETSWIYHDTLIKLSNCPYLVGGDWNMNGLFFYIFGMSSSQLTNSYFSEGWLNHQPDMFVNINWYFAWFANDNWRLWLYKTTESEIFELSLHHFKSFLPCHPHLFIEVLTLWKPLQSCLMEKAFSLFP